MSFKNNLLIFSILFFSQSLFANYGITPKWHFSPYPYQIHLDKFEETSRKGFDKLDSFVSSYNFQSRDGFTNRGLFTPFNLFNAINVGSVASKTTGDVSYEIGGEITAEILEGLNFNFQIRAGTLLTYMSQ